MGGEKNTQSAQSHELSSMRVRKEVKRERARRARDIVQ